MTEHEVVMEMKEAAGHLSEAAVMLKAVNGRLDKLLANHRALPVLCFLMGFAGGIVGAFVMMGAMR